MKEKEDNKQSKDSSNKQNMEIQVKEKNINLNQNEKPNIKKSEIANESNQGEKQSNLNDLQMQILLSQNPQEKNDLKLKPVSDASEKIKLEIPVEKEESQNPFNTENKKLEKTDENQKNSDISSDDDDELNTKIPETELIASKIMVEDEDEAQAIAEDSQSSELIKLVSNPHTEGIYFISIINKIYIDLLLFAIPVCAPYISLSNYKYKVKLVPGTLKRGKAVKLVMTLFMGQKDLIENEKKLIKAMSDNELVQAIIGNVKVGAAGYFID